MTMEDFENQWRLNLSKILGELKIEEYKDLLFQHLNKIPGGMKDEEHRGKMPQIIIKYYGLDESIKVISEAMDEIPRNDRKIQDLIKPMLLKLEDLNQQDANNRKKRKPGPESEEQQEFPSELKKKKKTESNDDDDYDYDDDDDDDDNDDDDKAEFEKNNTKSDSDSSGDETQSDNPGSQQSERNVSHGRQSIKLLKESRDTNGKRVGGKIIQKCALRPYKTKENQEKKFFQLAVADETDCVKVMVYGEEQFNKVEEGRLYLFTDVEVDVVYGETVMKVTKHSKISMTNGIKVSKTLELQNPFFSIKKIKSFKEETAVSVKGTVIEIDAGPQIEFQKDGTKVNTCEFKLEDETGYIWIKLWRKDTKQLRGGSVGDLVSVTNLLTNHYSETVSLNSTDFTRIHQVKAAAVQNVTMHIVGIIKAEKEQSELDVLINHKPRSFLIRSTVLAEAFRVKLDHNFKDRLLKKIPFSAKGKIKQNKIQTLKAAKVTQI